MRADRRRLASLWDSLRAALWAALLLGSLAQPARAGPAEAREAWERTRQLGAQPWRTRVRAYRAVRHATHARDPLVLRALAAEARVLREQGRVHAAAALEAWATQQTPLHEPERAARCDLQASRLEAEGDLAAAAGCWEQAARLARRELPWQADEALEALARLAAGEGDLAGLRRLGARAEAEGARPSTRILLWGTLGGVLLDRLGEPGVAEARRALALAGRAFQASAAGDAREAARAGKAWLDLPLRRRLPPEQAAR
ncbi:MAG: hypothetical protein ACKOSS_08655 [Planctomycetia bacterium]